MKNCKRVLSLLLSVLLAITWMQTAVFADNEAEQPNLRLIASDDFAGTNDTDLSTNPTGTGWTSGWCMDNQLSTAMSPNYLKISQNAGAVVTPIKWNTGEEFLCRGLSSPIDFNSNADYYIKYKMQNVINFGGSSFQRTILFTSGGSATLLTGLYRSDYLGTWAPAIDCDGWYQPNKGENMNDLANFTVLVRISARTGSNDIIRTKVFDEATDTFTYSPDAWDVETSVNKTDSCPVFAINASNRSGSDWTPTFDDIAVYKSAPIYVDTTFGTTPSNHYDPVKGETMTVSIPEMNLLGNTQVIKSCAWYDANNNTVGTGVTLTVPVSMLDEMLRCKLVVTDTITGTDSTYWPISGYVRDDVDVTAVKIRRIGWNNALEAPFDPDTRVEFNVWLSKNAPTQKNYQMICAVYSSDGRLKFIKSTPKTNLTGWPLLATINDWLQINGSPGEYTFASDDVIKVFLWDSYDNLIPLDTNKNTEIGKVSLP